MGRVWPLRAPRHRQHAFSGSYWLGIAAAAAATRRRLLLVVSRGPLFIVGFVVVRGRVLRKYWILGLLRYLLLLIRWCDKSKDIE